MGFRGINTPDASHQSKHHLPRSQRRTISLSIITPCQERLQHTQMSPQNDAPPPLSSTFPSSLFNAFLSITRSLLPFPVEQGIAISTFEKSFHFDAGASLRECCYNEEDFTLHNRQTTLRYYFVNRRSKRGEMRACLYPAILPASSAHQLPLYQFLFYKPLTTQSLCLRILNSRFPLYPVSSMLSKGI
jgi:hypothetical protein